MGLGGISLWQLLILLLIVVLLFGTKRLRNLGSDLGTAFRGFRSSLQEDDKNEEKESERLEADEPSESQGESEREKDRTESK